jgi:hypothetical protein
MELEAVGGNAEAEGVVRAVQRAGERYRSGREIEAVFVKREHADSAWQVGEQRVLPRRLEGIDVVDAELGLAPEDPRTESRGHELSAEANGETGEIAPYRIAEPATRIGRHAIDVEAAAEDDHAVVLVNRRQNVVRAQDVVRDADASKDACESTEARLRLVLKDGEAQRRACCQARGVRDFRASSCCLLDEGPVAHAQDLECECPAWRRHLDERTRAMAEQSPPNGSPDRDTPRTDAGLDRPDELVFGDVAVVEVAHKHGAPDSGTAVDRRSGDPRRREVSGQRGDSRLELGLLLEQFEESRVVGDVAVEARLAQPIGHVPAAVARQV